jgi:saccharopine dehydrogenase-like NADP-dependent oxidoreductase
VKIGIIGAGKIGRTVQKMLEGLAADSEVAIESVLTGDLHTPADQYCDVTDPDSLGKFVAMNDVIINALPFFLNKAVANACAAAGSSYFDFSEDVVTTAHVQTLALQNPELTFAPQCGLAPGAINIIGANLTKSLDKVKSLEMRVGALPLSANNEMKYYLSWSSQGLINEYLKPCDALYRGQPIKTLPLDGLEHITIDGVGYEAFNTSGGVATMCETYQGVIDDLNYKTIRYPGHLDHMRFVVHDLGLGDRPELLTEIFDQAVPATTEDVVLMYVNAVGTKNGKPFQCSYVKKVRAFELFNGTAIQTTTAAGMAAVVEMFLAGKLKKGFIRQESISFEDFTNTVWGKKVYGNAAHRS